MPYCNWPGTDMLMKRYHDKEWGKPNHSDRIHFEFLVLEGAQAGLNWKTIQHRREGYKEAFYSYDLDIISRMTESDIEKLLGNARIIRNRLKIRSAINNANRFIDVINEYGSFDNYIWGFTNGKVIDNKPKSLSLIPATSILSDKVSKNMKGRGFSFIGSTIIYAHLQAVGIVNDHLEGCPSR